MSAHVAVECAPVKCTVLAQLRATEPFLRSRYPGPARGPVQPVNTQRLTLTPTDVIQT
jgi:hypothetical protein